MNKIRSRSCWQLMRVGLPLIFWLASPHAAKASDTNVFLLTSSLTGTILSNGVRVVDSARIVALLGSTNANLVLALWVQDFDDLPTGLKPQVELVIFNRATTNVAARLLEFDLLAPGNVSLYQQARSVVAHAKAEPGAGVVDANVDALITYRRTPDGPRNFKLQPLGAIFFLSGGTTNSLIIRGGDLQGQGAPVLIP